MYSGYSQALIINVKFMCHDYSEVACDHFFNSLNLSLYLNLGFKFRIKM